MYARTCSIQFRLEAGQLEAAQGIQRDSCCLSVAGAVFVPVHVPGHAAAQRTASGYRYESMAVDSVQLHSFLWNRQEGRRRCSPHVVVSCTYA